MRSPGKVGALVYVHPNVNAREDSGANKEAG